MARIDSNLSGNQGDSAWLNDPLERWAVCPFPARVSHAGFNDGLAYTIKANGAAAAAAETITVDALPVKVPAGTLLWFGTGEFAKVTADAAEGATSLAVEALENGIEDNDEALYHPIQRKTIKAGTYVGRTFAERDAGTAYGAAVNTDDERFLTVNTVENAIDNPEVTLLRHGACIYEDLLPDWATISADANLLAKLRADYLCIKSAN